MKIEFYSKTTCPFCQRAKEYLTENGINYNEMLQDDDMERQAMYDRFGLQGNQRTVPQIFLVEEDGSRLRIGGYMDLLRSDVVVRHRIGEFNLEF